MNKNINDMTQAEFNKQMAEIKEKRPNLFQFISDFVDRKVSIEEVENFLNMKRSDQVLYIKNYQARI
jgi:hypothetical protein